ncbi:MAG: D-alanyl-D-alanine carboxypeptidase [Actinomycetaceae bacterium]|nr:D-alanyl-D-alanine carboxypeptidase [Actinomycetaceae bacterium]
MPKRSVTAILSVLALCAGISGYAIADLYDQVPGFFTLEAPESPAPVPQAATFETGKTFPDHMDTNFAPITSAQFAPLWKQLVADTKGARAGAYVLDAVTGNVLLNGNGHTPMQPASTTKVLTAFTVGTYLDSQQRLATRTFLGEDGAIHLVGEGDLMLAAQEGSETAVNGRAGLADLAKATAEALKERDSAGAGQGTPGANPAETGTPEANPATTSPTPSKVIYHDQIFTGPTREVGLEEELYNWVGHNTAFAIDRGEKPEGQYPPYYDNPAELAAQTLANRLAENGIEVQIERSDTPFDTANATALAQVQSATIGEITRLMMRASDNTLAEQLCRLSAHAAGKETSIEQSAALVEETVSKTGIYTEGIDLKNCSGLNENNLIAPRTTAEIIRQAWKGNGRQRDLLRDMPYAWFSGTLNSRFAQSSAAPWVVAKTGTLDHSSSLAGLATTRSGRVLIFQAQVDSSKEDAWIYRAALDRFATALTEQE